MGQEFRTYAAEKFLQEYRLVPAEKRLVFDAWADRMGFGPDAKRRLWYEVKTLSRQHGAAGHGG